MDLDDILEVLSFLRYNLRIEYLSASVFLRNLVTTSIEALKRSRDDINSLRHLPIYDYSNLKALLSLILGSELAGSEIVNIAKCCRPQDLPSMIPLDLLGLLVVYNARYHGYNPRLVNAVDMSNAPVWQGDDQSEAQVMARSLCLRYDADSKINRYGYTKLAQTSDKRIYVSAIHVGDRIPVPALKLILCHELIHMTISLHQVKPKSASAEEILCNAVMGQYTSFVLNTFQLPTAVRNIITYRSALCFSASRNKDPDMFHMLSKQLPMRGGFINALKSICF